MLPSARRKFKKIRSSNIIDNEVFQWNCKISAFENIQIFQFSVYNTMPLTLRLKFYKYLAICYALYILLVLPRAAKRARVGRKIILISLKLSFICHQFQFSYYWRSRRHTCEGSRCPATITVTLDTREHVIKYLGHVTSTTYILRACMSRETITLPSLPYLAVCVCNITCSTEYQPSL